MKKLFYICLVLAFAAVTGCDKNGNYEGGRVSPYIAIYDIRDIYRGEDVKLNAQNMFGATKLAAMVVSDHSGNNLPEGLVFVQDARRLDALRGIALKIGTEAAGYVPGDSLHVELNGATLTNEGGLLMVTDIPKGGITKVSSGNPLPTLIVPINKILEHPDWYEGTLSVIVKGSFNPLPAPTDVFSGQKMLNDGFGDIILNTLPGASIANDVLPFSANYYGIVLNTFNAAGDTIPEFRVRKADDIIVLSSEINIVPLVISGFLNDANGSDNNYEYIQLLATRDIDFSATPFSVVTTNNAGTAAPTGIPVNGWATGGARTFKFDLTSGFAAKGTYFYVGGTTKLINGSGSTDISSANWIRSFHYGNTNGDGFGTKTTNLLANSGNASGIAVFAGTTVTKDSKPLDVLFIGANGSVYSAGPPQVGYRIGDTDYYDVRNPITLEDQPFYKAGSNTLNLVYGGMSTGFFNLLGGEYNPVLGKWVKARSQVVLPLNAASTLTEIETEGATKLKE
ncbi:MAG: DUF5689 domain-containing protein [Chitinophagaceae bacterium]